jgi:type IV pilus assembly protein PilE
VIDFEKRGNNMFAVKHLRRTGEGFTLIELMIVVAVIALLAGVALPSYNESVRRGKRAEGRNALLKVAAVQERYFTANGTYATTTQLKTALGITSDIYSGDAGTPNGNAGSPYVITSAACSGGTVATCYVLSADPNAPFADTRCGTLTYANTGAKGESGTESVEYCWNR